MQSQLGKYIVMQSYMQQYPPGSIFLFGASNDDPRWECIYIGNGSWVTRTLTPIYLDWQRECHMARQTLIDEIIYDVKDFVKRKPYNPNCKCKVEIRLLFGCKCKG